MNLLATMLELGRLPDRVHVAVGDFPLHGQEVEDDMRLLDNFHVEIRAKDVLNQLAV